MVTEAETLYCRWASQDEAENGPRRFNRDGDVYALVSPEAAPELGRRASLIGFP